MKITLNLATRPYADLGPAIQRLRIAIAALALLCTVLLVSLHLIHNRAAAARSREHALDARLAAVTGEHQSYLATVARPDHAELLKQAAALNQLIDEKSFSWTLAMEALETVLPGGVQVTSIEPVRDKEGHIMLHLRVVGPQNLSVDLVRNLERSHRFILPRITAENSAESTTGLAKHLEPVSATNRFDFDILTGYNPPTEEERRAANAKATAPAPSAPPAGPRASRIPKIKSRRIAPGRPQ